MCVTTINSLPRLTVSDQSTFSSRCQLLPSIASASRKAKLTSTNLILESVNLTQTNHSPRKRLSDAVTIWVRVPSSLKDPRKQLINQAFANSLISTKKRRNVHAWGESGCRQMTWPRRDFLTIIDSVRKPPVNNQSLRPVGCLTSIRDPPLDAIWFWGVN
jgi:hypothetical protein